MKLSAQEEYGLRLLLQIGKAEPGRSVTIPELSRLEELSEPHVAKLLTILRKAGYIRSARGQSGGYFLAKLPGDIVIGEVLECLGGRLCSDAFCERHSGLAPSCTHHGDCALRAMWEDVQAAIDGVVYAKRLADLLEMSHRGGLVQLSPNRAVGIPR